MRIPSSLQLLVVLTALLAPVETWGQSGSDSGEEIEDYREAIAKGTQLFQKGEYSEARDAFEDAYAIFPGGDVLFNIASTYRREGKLERALETYEEVLKEEVDPERRKLSKRAIKELRAELASSSVDTNTKDETIEEEAPEVAEELKEEEMVENPESVQSSAVETSSSPTPALQLSSKSATLPWYRDRTGATLVGAGGLVLATGGYLMLDALAQARDASEASSHGAFASERDDAAKRRRLGGVLATVGGAALLFGAYRVVNAEPQRNRIEVASDGQILNVSFSGQF